jgi:hypothetical protein
LKKPVLLLLLFFISGVVNAQSDSCRLRISLLTCTPGEELYSTFGHSALRVIDSSTSQDLIYNYGTFDFDDPDFYSKFVRGKLLYFVSVDEFSNFMYEYQYEKRGITEQVLDLSCSEKKGLNSALQKNALDENKYYKYDFVNDNCTTRLRDIVNRAAKDSIITTNILPARDVSFRTMIHTYLDNGGEVWSKLGIDILLGSPLDKKISNNEAMFLPDYLLKAFDNSSINSKKLVSEKEVILKGSPVHVKTSVFTPVIIFSFLLLVIIGLGFSDSVFIHKLLKIFDFVFFLLLGSLGVLLLFMWFGTDHQTCRDNFNLAWAFPLHLPMAFSVFKNKGWVKKYFLFIAVVAAALLAGWLFLPQQLNNALLPVTALISVRSIALSRRK